MSHVFKAVSLSAVVLAALAVGPMASAQKKEKLPERGHSETFPGLHGLKTTVRVMIPQEQEADVLFLCYFKHKPAGDKVLDVIQEFDDKLGGVIGALRSRGEFQGNELETFLITPPEGKIKAKQLMLIGLGEEDKLSPQTMNRIGAVAMREALRLRAKTAAFGAALRDQGNETIPTGKVASEVLQGVMLAYDTEKRLEKEKFTPEPALKEWIYLAGPKYYLEVEPLAKQGVAAAAEVAKKRTDGAYSKPK